LLVCTSLGFTILIFLFVNVSLNFHVHFCLLIGVSPNCYVLSLKCSSMPHLVPLFINK
jgi:hypothetical protein